MNRILLTMIAGALAWASPAAAQPGDFGDAPDGRPTGYPLGLGSPDGDFPSLDASGGPFHLDVQQEWLGLAPDSDTTVEPDSLQVDADAADGPLRLFILAVAIPAPTWITVPVTARPPFDTARFLNVLVDVDRDGDWSPGMFDEWVVRNRRVDFGAGQVLANGNRRTFVTGGPFIYAPGRVLGPAWIRATVTRRPIATPAGPWTGMGPPGGFANGETEDLIARFGRGGPPPPPPKRCRMRLRGFPNPVPTPPGAFVLQVQVLRGPCPNPALPPAPPGVVSQVTLVGCVGTPIGFAPAPPFNGPPPPVPPPPVINHPSVAAWGVPGPRPRRATCVFRLNYDPEGESYSEEIEVEYVEAVEGCGDEILEPALEECDDGNTVGGDGCSADCRIEVPYVADGEVGGTEECDDGNEVDGDGCSADGLSERCGNGRVDAGEGCDDGNTDGGDGCSMLCWPEQGFPPCPNGVVDLGEECDDGAGAPGDGCNAGCQGEDTCVGDLNGDGQINVLDAQRLIAAVLDPTRITTPAADVNGDGRIDILDAQRTIAKVLRRVAVEHDARLAEHGRQRLAEGAPQLQRAFDAGDRLREFMDARAWFPNFQGAELIFVADAAGGAYEAVSVPIISEVEPPPYARLLVHLGEDPITDVPSLITFGGGVGQLQTEGGGLSVVLSGDEAACARPIGGLSDGGPGACAGAEPLEVQFGPLCGGPCGACAAEPEAEVCDLCGACLERLSVHLCGR